MCWLSIGVSPIVLPVKNTTKIVFLTNKTILNSHNARLLTPISFAKNVKALNAGYLK
jgi:hypothetical protein